MTNRQTCEVVVVHIANGCECAVMEANAMAVPNLTLRTRLKAAIDWYASQGGPAYRRVPSELVVSDFFDGIAYNADALVTFLETGKLPTAHDLRAITDLAMTRLASGATLGEVTGAYQEVSAALWRRVVADSSPSDRAALADLIPRVAEYIFQVVSLIATEAAHRSGDPLSDVRERNRAAADELLRSGEATGLFDVGPGANYTIAVFQIAGSSTAGSALGDLKARIEAFAHTYVRLDLNGWVVVHWFWGDVAAAVARFRGKLEHARAHTSVQCWAGIASSTTAYGVPGAYRRAAGLAATAQKLRRADFVVDLGQVAIEYLSATAGPDIPALVEIVEPLSHSDPVFGETLRVFFDKNCNQLATARAMHVHRNSVTYRLAKVHTLTGLNPLNFAEAASLHAALIALRMVQE
ncbi:helix-turn-helix domain-containing protein [Hoyosella sp. YIM 151337]|uniref:PucR family transcriptional regulator n=1 Tax=Hoyosella sp. YIM 151337 TaxID=2992742 RepID=UPI002235C514|nr:PucR family transcriptional regulator [Hoyosella sp. YIM 151337]MCW4352824.1 helix-turn-helix domain-containing protein [Hoyosella sp. YIM 151337]